MIHFASKLGIKVSYMLLSLIMFIRMAKRYTQVYAASSSSPRRDLTLSSGASEYIAFSKANVADYMSSFGGANLIICTAPSAKGITTILPLV